MGSYVAFGIILSIFILAAAFSKACDNIKEKKDLDDI